jgi:hypothetical protein
MKLFALIIPAFAALAPMQAFATTGSDQTSVQAPKAQPQMQVATGEDNGNTCGNGILNILNCNDVDIGVDIL